MAQSDIHDDDDNEGALEIRVTEELDGVRLDKALAVLCPDLSRTRIKGLIETGAVANASGIVRDVKLPVRSGQDYTIRVPEAVAAIPQAENIPLNIVYEDDDLLVINKPAGLVVHPGAGHATGTLVNALLHHCGDTLSGIGGVLRPGIVHRLDMDTTGLMVVAKNDAAHRGLSAQLADRTLHRVYAALVWGVPPHKGVVDKPVGRHPAHRQKMAVNVRGAREARTHFHVDRVYNNVAAMVSCKLDTGRTHQIRVHMAAIRHPLVGDPLYGLQRNAQIAALKKGGLGADDAPFVVDFPRQALHARQIGFIHPVSGADMGFEADVPDDIARLFSLFETMG